MSDNRKHSARNAAIDAGLLLLLAIPIIYVVVCYDGSSKTIFGIIPVRWGLLFGTLLPCLYGMNFIITKLAKAPASTTHKYLRLGLFILPVVLAAAFSLVFRR